VNSLYSKNDPVIDLILGARLAGNKPDLAKELLSLLVKTLPDDLRNVEQAFINNQYEQLRSLVHKLRGACSYCGAPRLKNVLAEFDNALKQNATEKLQPLINDFAEEATLLIQKAAEIGV
jgi:two-component system sensor histidine kinase BarA